ncbi:MAG: class II aldolase/adducin family protein [Clostridia bacterium]|nr:class II aldolase/adducin family protein [Clostridia bacterium]
MTFAFCGRWDRPAAAWFAAGIRAALEARGHRFTPTPRPECRLVFNGIDPAQPRPYRRRAKATFVVAVGVWEEEPDDPLKAGYPLLIRALANLGVFLVPVRRGATAHFVTLERGHYIVDASEQTPGDPFQRLLARIEPLASSRLVIDNIFERDLEPSLWEGDALTDAIRRAGERLAALDLLPAPFPLEDVLDENDRRHLLKLFGIGGLSYGNLSARRDAHRFWMSASGVDKGRLRTVGRDILLVKGFDPEREAIVLSVPPHVEPRRVSVDAIEHWMIYREHPRVGAIVHVHAWMEGAPCTEFGYPCGTIDLARAVAEQLRRAPDPARAVVGLKNHGITVTGPDLDDIFERLEGRVVRQVPMS